MSTTRKRRLAGPDPAGQRHSQGFRAVGVAAAALAAPVVVKRGGVLVRLKTEWSAIIGPELAATTWPEAFGRDGVLKLRTMQTAALELQHRAPLLIERINLYFGRSAVTRLVFVQAMKPPAPETKSCAVRSRGDGNADAFGALLSGIADPTLRAALGRLARAISATRD